jgi:hypothetical protein
LYPEPPELIATYNIALALNVIAIVASKPSPSVIISVKIIPYGLN